MTDAAVRFGEADLSTCDREPIHIPGSIQPHGVLLVVERRSLCVEQVAGDTARLLGVEPAAVIGLHIGEILDTATVGFVAARLESPAHFVPPQMHLRVSSRAAAAPLDLTLHAIAGTAIIELEPAHELLQGTHDPIVLLKSMLAAVQHTSSLQECCAAAAVTMRSATGFDRAMVYRFLPNGSGVVIAENARADLESYLGLHYPASDIPQQARELYRRNWLRAIANIDYVPAPLLPETNGRTGRPIDMSHCDLRSVSPIHLEYLRNMGVCASLSASLICRNELWGMLVLHHYSPHRVAAHLRVACETFAQTLSLQIEAKVHAENALARNEKHGLREELVGRLTGAEDIGATLAFGNLPQYLGATGAAICLAGQLYLLGETPSPTEITLLVAWLNQINRPLFSTEHLAAEYPPAAGFAAAASGLVAAGLSRLPRDYILWFRPEMGRTVRWAGDPSKPIKVDRHGARLTPRGSFTEWLEVTRMQSAPWTEVDLEAAEALRVVLLETVLRGVDLARRERELEQTRIMTEQLELRVAQRTEQLRALSADLEAVEDRERRQIARDLHDDLGQTLAAARIRLANLCQHENAGVARAAAAIDSLLDDANAAIRSLAEKLAPDVLHELGLVPALESLGEEIERTFAVRVTIDNDGRPMPLAASARSILYRGVRELLINVAKHAQSDSATVALESLDGRLRITVADRGIGYDARLASGRRRGLGLISLKERLTYIGGAVDILTAPGAGTTAVLTLPLAMDEAGESEHST